MYNLKEYLMFGKEYMHSYQLVQLFDTKKFQQKFLTSLKLFQRMVLVFMKCWKNWMPLVLKKSLFVNKQKYIFVYLKNVKFSFKNSGVNVAIRD